MNVHQTELAKTIVALIHVWMTTSVADWPLAEHKTIELNVSVQQEQLEIPIRIVKEVS